MKKSFRCLRPQEGSSPEDKSPMRSLAGDGCRRAAAEFKTLRLYFFNPHFRAELQAMEMTECGKHGKP